MDLHVFPIPIPPPTSLSIHLHPSLLNDFLMVKLYIWKGDCFSTLTMLWFNFEFYYLHVLFLSLKLSLNELNRREKHTMKEVK